MLRTRRGVGAYRWELAMVAVSPTRTAVIFTMEPVFAGLFGFLLAGERLSGRGWLGAGLILAGMLVAELGGRRPAAPGRPLTNGGQP